MLLQTPSAPASSQQVLTETCAQSGRCPSDVSSSKERHAAPVLVLGFGRFLCLTVSDGESDAGGSVTGGVCLHLAV